MTTVRAGDAVDDAPVPLDRRRSAIGLAASLGGLAIAGCALRSSAARHGAVPGYGPSVAYEPGPLDLPQGAVARDHGWVSGPLELQISLPGACCSPDARTLYVNAYSLAQTLAIARAW